MKCPECERLGQRSKFFMPTHYFTTAMGGSQRYYDEDGEYHYHEVNVSSGQASCSLGHIFDVRCADKCKAPGCEYGHEQTITLLPPRPAEPEPEYFTWSDSFTWPHNLGGGA